MVSTDWRSIRTHEIPISLNQLNMTNSNQPRIGRLNRYEEYNVKALKAICTDSVPVMYLVEWVQSYEPFVITSDSWQDCPELSPSQVNQLLTPDCRSMTMAEIKVMQDKKRTIRNMIFTFSTEVWEVLRPGMMFDDEGGNGPFPVLDIL